MIFQVMDCLKTVLFNINVKLIIQLEFVKFNTLVRPIYNALYFQI
jgi:hypothetical protein